MIDFFKFGVVGLTERSPSLLVMTPPPASREPPRGGSLFPNPAEILCPISGFCPRSLGSLREGAPARRRVRENACRKANVLQHPDNPKFEISAYTKNDGLI